MLSFQDSVKLVSTVQADPTHPDHQMSLPLVAPALWEVTAPRVLVSQSPVQRAPTTLWNSRATVLSAQWDISVRMELPTKLNALKVSACLNMFS